LFQDIASWKQVPFCFSCFVIFQGKEEEGDDLFFLLTPREDETCIHWHTPTHARDGRVGVGGGEKMGECNQYCRLPRGAYIENKMLLSVREKQLPQLHTHTGI
jgi:hypothetical protein